MCQGVLPLITSTLAKAISNVTNDLLVGYSQSALHVDGDLWEMDGASIGAGVDFAMTKRVTVGLEYLSRDVSALPTGGGVNKANTTVDTLSLGVGLSF